jgi:hypothetical protein
VWQQEYFNSFVDAPGYGIYDEDDEFVGIESGSKFKEELSEINISLGLEYLYAQKFAVRAGWFNEAYSKGNRKFISMGAGFRFSKFELRLIVSSFTYTSKSISKYR